MVDVLLISPPFVGLAREPLGLYYLSGALKSNGISNVIYDFMVETPTKKGFREYMIQLNPKIVGITSYTFNYSVTLEIVHEIKQINPEVTIVMGGVHASSLPVEVLEKEPLIDYIILGEGERTFAEFCRMVLDGECPKNINGVAYRDSEVVINKPQELIMDLNTLPFPDRKMLPMDKYPISVVQTSRGCPYSCIFCRINTHYERKIRFRDPENVAEECSELVNHYKRDKIYFFGDAFTFNNDWVEELCDQIERKKLKFQWGCETRVDNVTVDLLKRMRKAGCIEVQYGIDYGDESVLRILGKNTSIQQVDDAVRWSKTSGLFVQSFFIFNCPGENEETIENTYNLIQKTPIDAVEINLLTPYPGTHLWDNLEKFNMKIVNHDFNYYNTKKYVIENLDFPKKKFVPTFKKLLKRLNMTPVPGYTPEIYNFLKKDVRLGAWSEKGIRNPILKL